jgi:hypothetical protein
MRMLGGSGMESDYARKWLVTLISGVSSENDYLTFFWGTARECALWATDELIRDENGDSPEYHGFSMTHKEKSNGE